MRIATSAFNVTCKSIVRLIRRRAFLIVLLLLFALCLSAHVCVENHWIGIVRILGDHRCRVVVCQGLLGHFCVLGLERRNLLGRHAAILFARIARHVVLLFRSAALSRLGLNDFFGKKKNSMHKTSLTIITIQEKQKTKKRRRGTRAVEEYAKQRKTHTFPTNTCFAGFLMNTISFFSISS